MERELNRYPLVFSKAFDYIQNVLADGNALAQKLKAHLLWESGKFFALVREPADWTRVYDFKYGGIRPILPEKIPHVVIYSKAILIQWMISKMQKENLSCLLEDVTSLSTDLHTEFFETHGLTYKGQIYYCIDSREATVELFRETIYKADAIWYFFCLLTKEPCRGELSEKKIKAICNKTSAVIVGAYDEEGYVIWERCGCINTLQAT